jgi:hypothetical protein
LDVSLEVLQRGAVFPPLLHQINLLSDKFGILLRQLLFNEFPIFLRHLEFCLQVLVGRTQVLEL